MTLIIFHTIDASTTLPIGGVLLSSVGGPGPWRAMSNPCGDAITELTPGHYDITFSMSGYKNRVLPADLHDCGVITVGLDRNFDTVPVPSPGKPGWLHSDGLILRHDDNSPACVLGVTAFPLLQQWIYNRPKALTFMNWMQRSGIVMARSLGMFNGGLGRFLPTEVGQNYREYLGTLIRQTKDRSLRLKLSVFADSVVPLAAQYSFFDSIAGVCNGNWNVALDGGNEWPKNGWDPSILAKPGVCLSSRGSSLGGATPPANPWDFFDNHPTRNDDWPKGCKEIYDIQHGNVDPPGPALAVPGCQDEPIGIGEVYESGRTTNSPDDCFDFAAGSKLFGAGIIILHVRSGMTLDTPGPIAQACVDASRDAIGLVRDNAATGRYTAGHLSDCPIAHDDALALRTYAKIHDQDGTADVVVLRPKPGWVPIPQNGWRIQSKAGPRGNILVMGR